MALTTCDSWKRKGHLGMTLLGVPGICPWAAGHAASLPEHTVRGDSEHPEWPRRARLPLCLGGADPGGHPSIPGTAGHFQSTGRADHPGSPTAGWGEGSHRAGRPWEAAGLRWSPAPLHPRPAEARLLQRERVTCTVGCGHRALPSTPRANPAAGASAVVAGGLTRALGVLQVVELPGLLVPPDHASDFCCDCKWH